jgi:chemotaxis signal transduction protein
LTSLSPIAAKVAELRSVFDQARAAPFSAGAEEQTETLLAIRVSRDAFAIRIAEVSSLATDSKIVALPSSVHELLGVAGMRGTLVPVYSLAALLGYGTEPEQARWLAVCGNDEPFALAFGVFEGYLRVPLTGLYEVEQKDAARSFLTHVARATEMVRAVVSIPVLRQAIQERCGDQGVPKER